MKIELPCRRELDSEGSKATKNRRKIDENVVKKPMLGKKMQHRFKFAQKRRKNALERLLGGPWRVLSKPLAAFRDPPGAPLAPPSAPDGKDAGS